MSAKSQIKKCLSSMDEKLMEDNNFSVLGWPERFKKTLAEAQRFEAEESGKLQATWSEDEQQNLRACIMVMNKKLMADEGSEVEGWREQFKEVHRTAHRYIDNEKQKELDKIFDFAANTLHDDDAPICPFCESLNCKSEDSRCTLVGSGNHHWYYCHCEDCHKPFTREVKYTFGDKSKNVWYTKGEKVLRGIPSCFETYILDCKSCKGDLRKRYFEPDGVSPWTKSYLSHDPESGPCQRCFYVCDSCGAKNEYPLENWRPRE